MRLVKTVMHRKTPMRQLMHTLRVKVWCLWAVLLRRGASNWHVLMYKLLHLQTTHDNALQVSDTLVLEYLILHLHLYHQAHHYLHVHLYHQAHYFQLQLCVCRSNMPVRQLSVMHLQVTSSSLPRPAHRQHLLLTTTATVLSATVRQAAGGQYFGI